MRHMTIDTDPEVRRELVDTVRRFIAREVETRIARALVAGDVRDGAVIKVGLADGELSVSYDNPA